MVIRVDTSILRQSSGNISELGINVGQVGQNILGSAQSAPSYDGQFGSKVNAIGAQALSRAQGLKSQMNNDSSSLQNKAQAFEAADLAGATSFTALASYIPTEYQSAPVPGTTLTPTPAASTSTTPATSAPSTPTTSINARNTDGGIYSEGIVELKRSGFTTAVSLYVPKLGDTTESNWKYIRSLNSFQEPDEALNAILLINALLGGWSYTYVRRGYNTPSGELNSPENIDDQAETLAVSSDDKTVSDPDAASTLYGLGILPNINDAIKYRDQGTKFQIILQQRQGQYHWPEDGTVCAGDVDNDFRAIVIAYPEDGGVPYYVGGVVRALDNIDPESNIPPYFGLSSNDAILSLRVSPCPAEAFIPRKNGFGMDIIPRKLSDLSPNDKITVDVEFVDGQKAQVQTTLSSYQAWIKG